MRTLASAGSTWGGETVGIVAATVFVVFAAWILVQRLRHGPSGSPEKDDDE